jgi:hypothetical protein
VTRLVHASAALNRGMRQRLSAVPIAARSRSSNVAAPGDPEPVFTETLLLDDLVS